VLLRSVWLGQSLLVRILSSAESGCYGISAMATFCSMANDGTVWLLCELCVKLFNLCQTLESLIFEVEINSVDWSTVAWSITIPCVALTANVFSKCTVYRNCE